MIFKTKKKVGGVLPIPGFDLLSEVSGRVVGAGQSDSKFKKTIQKKNIRNNNKLGEYLRKT